MNVSGKAEGGPAPSTEMRGGPIVERLVTEEFVDYLTGVGSADIPAATLQAARRLLLDFVSVALRGSRETSSRIVSGTVDRLSGGGGEGSVVIGHPGRRGREYAALINGVSSHGLELDDIHPIAAIHPGAAVFPTVLAVGEAVDAGGRDMLAAAVIGYEISCRLSRALVPAQHGGHGFHSTSTCGVFGAAGAAARLMELPADQFINALGIAGSQAAGLTEFLSNGAWTKRMHPGWAAHGGIISAELARGGFTGPRRIFEGKSGFLRSYSDAPRVECLLEGIGQGFQIEGVAIKPHAACRYSQAAIDAMLQLVRDNDVKPDQVEKIVVGTFGGAIPVVAEPLSVKRRPRSMVDAQFSVHFAVATALLKGAVTLADYQPERLGAPEVLALMDRVECVHRPDMDALFPRIWAASVEIALGDGRVFEKRIDTLHGDPDDPLSWDELKSKAQTLMSGVVPAARARDIIETIEGLEDGNARALARLLQVDS